MRGLHPRMDGFPGTIERPAAIAGSSPALRREAVG